MAREPHTDRVQGKLLSTMPFIQMVVLVVVVAATGRKEKKKKREEKNRRRRTIRRRKKERKEKINGRAFFFFSCKIPFKISWWACFSIICLKRWPYT